MSLSTPCHLGNDHDKLYKVGSWSWAVPPTAPSPRPRGGDGGDAAPSRQQGSLHHLHFTSKPTTAKHLITSRATKGLKKCRCCKIYHALAFLSDLRAFPQAIKEQHRFSFSFERCAPAALGTNICHFAFTLAGLGTTFLV